jgi:hypothetical protein
LPKWSLLKTLPRSPAWRTARAISIRLSRVYAEVYVHEDRYGEPEWRVEYFDDDGGCYVTIFAGPSAEQRARDYFAALKAGAMKIVRDGPPTH